MSSSVSTMHIHPAELFADGWLVSQVKGDGDHLLLL